MPLLKLIKWLQQLHATSLVFGNGNVVEVVHIRCRNTRPALFIQNKVSRATDKQETMPAVMMPHKNFLHSGY